MLQISLPSKKPSPWLLFPITLLLTLYLSCSWVNAKEPPKPKPQQWQINGIVAALDDDYDEVKGYAFNKLTEYDLKDLKLLLPKPEEIAEKATKILKDKSLDSDVRSSAARALGNLRDAAKPYIQNIVDILKDKSNNYFVRFSVAEALGKLGDDVKPYIKDIIDILKNKSLDSDVRSGAARALGNLGDAAKPYIQNIVDIFKDRYVDSNVRSSAVEALGNLGIATQPYVKDIVNILKDKSENSSVRRSTAGAFGNLGNVTKPYIKDILNILKDKTDNSSVRISAAYALGNLEDAAKPYMKDIADILKDKSVDSFVRWSAAEALGKLGDAAKPYIKEIVDILKDKSDDSFVRSGTAQALGQLGDVAKPYIKDIVDILKDKSDNSSVRDSAAWALGKLGNAAQLYIKDILNFLKDKNLENYTGYDAAQALVNLGYTAKPYIKDILNILKEKSLDSDIRQIVAEALGKIEKLNLNSIVIILDNIYYVDRSKFEQWRFLTYFLNGGSDEVRTLLKWLGEPKTIPNQIKYDEGKKTLNLFLQIWKPTEDLPELRKDLASKVATVARQSSWQPQDILLLEAHYKNLKQAGYNEADSILSVIINLQGWQYFFNARNTIITHLAFWLALIFAYPKFPQVQAIFFWNPWVRRILGMGYVGFLLTWFPFFRRKLFEPFKPSLLADAALDRFDAQAYFPTSKLKIPGTEDTVPITTALPSIKGQIIIEGDSGLGKSMFIRHLLKNSRQIIVYLPAQKCENGVIEAIQAKLHGQAQDENFLKNLIYSGALDICIDGLNEVTADTRAKITQFVESYFRGNIIMTTQPLEWTPPSTAKIYKLQPLEQNQIQDFLLSRAQRLPQNAKIQGKDYQKACTEYLNQTLHHPHSLEELAASQRILSNPMDLSFNSSDIFSGAVSFIL